MHAGICRWNRPLLCPVHVSIARPTLCSDVYWPPGRGQLFFRTHNEAFTLAISKSGERFVRIRSRTRSNSFSACSRRDSSLKRCYEIRNNWRGRLSMKTQIPNINVVRSAWRRVKKDIKDAIIRDLKPVKDVKGGGGVTGESKANTGGTGTTGTTGRH